VMFASYARMRYRMIPYLYSAALEGHEEAMPIIRPMPLAFPEDAAVARTERQYMLGEDLLVSAYADRVHLPAGRWVDAWTGEEYVGPCDIDPYIPPANRGGGLFIRGGAIIPGWKDRGYIAQFGEEEITLDIYPDGDREYIFREDDGISLDYQKKDSCHTKITVTETPEKVTVNIGKREGDYEGKPVRRTWLVRVHPVDPDADQLLEVKCDEADRVIFAIPKKKNLLFDVDASDVLK
ncbi:MAG: DUF5110 domain-containing protein, partial [Clostridia bacterium]|nr:DUF5110 domain-containing protein [Clostridia bacterium]